VPFRVFGGVARRGTFPSPRRPLGIRASYRVFHPLRYRVYRFRDPGLPLAISPAVRSSHNGPRRPPLSSQCILSSSSTFLQSLAQRHLAGRPQPTGSSHGLSFPSAHEGSEVHSPRALPARYVPPAGFGYPLGGLRPPSPCRPYFIPAALLGFTLRSFLLPEGIQPVSGWKNPHTVSPASIPAPKAQAGLASRGSWVSTLPGVPGDQTCF
jgi:hypothetical protein